MFEDFWPDTVQKCRGLIIDPTVNHNPCSDCTIISRPFHKFFNLNHASQPDYSEANLPAVVPTVTEKMDGWFGIMWKCKGRGPLLSMAPNWSESTGYYYGIASRGSFTSPGAEFATQKLQKLVKYGAVEEFPEGYTPVFEIIFKDGKVVVDYPFEGLVLLALVNNETGEEMPYDDMQLIWAKIAGYSKDKPWIRLVKAHRMDLKDCLAYENTILAATRKPAPQVVGDKEGFVLSYNRPGTYPIKVKVKLEEYKRLHKLITGVTPQQIWETLHDPMSPWLGSNVPDHFRKWALHWRDNLYASFHNGIVKAEFAEQTLRKLTSPEILSNIDNRKDEQSRANRKAITQTLDRVAPDYVAVVLSNLDGKHYEAHQIIWKSIRPVGREAETFYREGEKE
jgi:RNA ligase